MIKKENWNYAPRQQVKQSKKAWAVLGLTNSICKCQDQWISPKMVLGGPYKSNLCWAAATNTVHSQHLHLVECLYYIGNPKDLLGTQDVFPLLQNKPRWPLPSPHHTPLNFQFSLRTSKCSELRSNKTSPKYQGRAKFWDCSQHRWRA